MLDFSVACIVMCDLILIESLLLLFFFVYLLAQLILKYWDLVDYIFNKKKS